MDQETIIYLGICSVFILAVMVGSGYGPFGIVVFILALIALIFVFMMNYVDFVIFPIFTNITRTSILLSKDHTVPKSQDCVLKYINGLYYATGYLTANIFNYIFRQESIVEGEDAKMVDASEKWERMVMSVDFPFKFSVISSAMDIQKFREELEGQRGYVEFQMSRENVAENPNSMTLSEMQRKINQIQARIDRISGGEAPILSVMYIETMTVGVSEKEAMDNLTNQINRLETIFNAFDLSIMRVVGRELHTLFKFGYQLAEADELEKLFNLQK